MAVAVSAVVSVAVEIEKWSKRRGPIAAPAAGAPAQELAATRGRRRTTTEGDAIAMMPFVRPVVILAAGVSEAGIRLEELL